LWSESRELEAKGLGQQSFGSFKISQHPSCCVLFDEFLDNHKKIALSK